MLILDKKQRELLIKIESDLNDRYGPIIGGKDLQKVLGYRSGDAYRFAVSKGTIPIPIFPLKHRRGRFALANDVATWLVEQRYSQIAENNKKESPMN